MTAITGFAGASVKPAGIMHRFRRALPYAALIAVLVADALLPDIRQAPIWRIDMRLAWQWSRLQDRPGTYEWFLRHWGSDEIKPMVARYADDADWRQYRDVDTYEGYRDYLGQYPDGRHRADALAGQDNRLWDRTKTVMTEDTLKSYVATFPNGIHVVEAQELLLLRQWEEAARSSSIPILRDFLARYPGSIYEAAAKTQIEHLRWDELARTRNIGAIEQYIGENRDGPYADQAQSLLKQLKREAIAARYRQGANLSDLLTEKIVAVEVDSVQPSNFTVQWRNLREFEVRSQSLDSCALFDRNQELRGVCVDGVYPVQLAPGASALASYRVLWLAPFYVPPVRTPALAASDLEFRPPVRNEILDKLYTTWEATGRTSFDVLRAAVWIAIANSSLPAFLSNGIGIPAAAAAMKLVNDAGIDIRTRAIWQDRAAVQHRASAALEAWIRTLQAETRAGQKGGGNSSPVGRGPRHEN